MRYTEHIRQAAHEAFNDRLIMDCDANNLWANMALAWQDLERKLPGYDVFGAGTKARDLVDHMIGLMYDIAGEASPDGDTECLLAKDREYGGSWCRRGGQGAFFSAVRKYDRIVLQVSAFGGDLARALREDKRTEGIRDDLNDLRCCMILWEAWWRARDEALSKGIRE